MKKLIHVVRGLPDRGVGINIINNEGEPFRFHRSPEVVFTKNLSHESNFTKDGEFFLVNQVDVDTAVAALASQNPGCEVRVYGLETVGQCPAGPFVTKKVTEHGVLPGMGDAPAAKKPSFI